MASTRSASTRPTVGARANQQVTLYELRERVDQGSCEALLASVRMQEMRDSDHATWTGIVDTVRVSQHLGGFVTVRYYMDQSQEGYGRMKTQVLAEGKQAVPYARMKRDARAHLAAAHYWDLDMANCQPNLFRQELDRHGIPSPMLDRYVADRASCLTDVMRACQVDRATAKQLFLRIMFFGGVKAWLVEHNIQESAVPTWVSELKVEMRRTAAALIDKVEFQALRAHHANRELLHELPHCTNKVASIMALHLQSCERACVCALVDAIQADARAIGAIIYDGVLVERSGPHEKDLPQALVDRWVRTVHVKTGYMISLEVKPLNGDPAWLQPAEEPTATPRNGVWDDSWMDGTAILTYADMKSKWERRSFKIVRSGNYVREEKEERVLMSEHELVQAYRHLSYDDVTCSSNGAVSIVTKPFIARWINDKTIKAFKDMVLAPPPRTVAPMSYNIWSEPDVARYAPTKPVNPDSDGVRLFHGFIDTLCSHNAALTNYVLDWMAQLFQEPAKKTGIALLLKGEEGAGKNRCTDLLRMMLGEHKFMQTANPSSTLYGRFTRMREGKFLVVVNEAKGGDSFSANDIIKDMITCDQFVCEGKGTNAYTMNCFARFIFTTNNENCLKVNPDSRRYLVIDVSSELRGNTAYFKELTLAMEDPHTRHEFWTSLMARDLRGVDWINHRPATAGMQDMVAQNLPLEHQYLKAIMLERLRFCIDGETRHATAQSTRCTISVEALYTGFQQWLVDNQVTTQYERSRLKFAHKFAKLVRNDVKKTGFRSVGKHRNNTDTLYDFDVVDLVREMRDAKWLSEDEMASIDTPNNAN